MKIKSSTINDLIKRSIQYDLERNPCAKGNSCRPEGCWFDHARQRWECHNGNGKDYEFMALRTYNMDRNCSQWVRSNQFLSRHTTRSEQDMDTVDKILLCKAIEKPSFRRLRTYLSRQNRHEVDLDAHTNICIFPESQAPVKRYILQNESAKGILLLNSASEVEMHFALACFGMGHHSLIKTPPFAPLQLLLSPIPHILLHTDIPILTN